MFLPLFLLSFISVTSSSNLNGDIYDISNRNLKSESKFSTDYSDISKNYKYFDVYSHPITSRYGDVYWTMMDDVQLPENIVNEFNNKTMAIVGYEMDQVFKGADDVSLPITWAYNHHYIAYILGGDSKLINYAVLRDSDHGYYNHGAKKTWTVYEGVKVDNIPNTQMFSEGNGGESRVSFHGYPSNMAQLIRSPKTFKLQPMQIDTRNRDPKYINDPVFHAGIMPKSSAAPVNASYSGLLECPCTTRINKTIIHDYNTITQNYCENCINNATVCLEQSLNFNNNLSRTSNVKIINTNTLPHGCSFIKDENGYITNIFLNSFNSNITCGENALVREGFTTFSQENINMTVNIDLTKNISEQLHITLTGPANVWYGVAFNAITMNDLPYSIIVDGYGLLYEYKLGNHFLGTLLKPSLKVVSSTVKDNYRTVVLSRMIYPGENYYDFKKSTIPILGAVGNNRNISYHKFRSGQNFYLGSVNSTTCVCDGGVVEGLINGIHFSKRCAPEPVGDLLHQKNPSCFIETYQGGLSCCHHKNILLDKDQVQPEHNMTYQLKFRFWYQDYENHKSLIRLYFQTEAYSGEYDIPKCQENDECIHVITARWQAKDMVSNNDRFLKNDTLRLAYAGPHCHAPTCISMELINEDTGETLCKVDGTFGKGNISKKFDEKDYIKINPCLWGYEDGLLEPPILYYNTNLSSIKRANNTNAHYGEMASWQMRGYLE